MKIYICFFTFLFLLSSCASWEQEREEKIENVLVQDMWVQEEILQTSTLILKNPETARPNTSFSPLFEWQTRVPGMKTQTPYEISLLQDNLWEPWGIVQLPDFTLLIAEKSGTFLLLSDSWELLQEIESPFWVDDRGQGWLLDVTLDPNFIENSLMYWTFSERVSGGNLLSVAKWTLSRDRTSIEDAKVIFSARYWRLSLKNPSYHSRRKSSFSCMICFMKVWNL